MKVKFKKVKIKSRRDVEKEIKRMVKNVNSIRPWMLICGIAAILGNICFIYSVGMGLYVDAILSGIVALSQMLLLALLYMLEMSYSASIDYWCLKEEIMFGRRHEKKRN